MAEAVAEGVSISEPIARDSGEHHLITVVCPDRQGLLSQLSEHLRAHEVDVVHASVATDTESGHVVDAFAVRDARTHGRLSDATLAGLTESLWAVATGTAQPAEGCPALARISAASYPSHSLTTVAAQTSPARASGRRASAEAGSGVAVGSSPSEAEASFSGGVDEATDVTLSNEEGDDQFTMLRVEVPDRPGLLTDLVQTLRVANVSVVAASIRTHGATAVDVFKLRDAATGGQLSSARFEALRRGVAHRARRQAISQSLGHAPSEYLPVTPPAAPPPASALAALDAACAALPPLRALSLPERAAVYAHFHALRFPPGAVLLEAGAEVQHFVVVLRGELRGGDRALRPGSTLGELGIVQSALAVATWAAGPEGADVYAVERRTLQALLHGAASARRDAAAAALRSLPFLAALPAAQLYALVDVMARLSVPSGQPLPPAFLHILVTGAARLDAPDALLRAAPAAADADPLVARAGDAYGEAIALARASHLPPAALTAVALEDVELLLCDRDTFARVLGPPEALLRAPAESAGVIVEEAAMEEAEAPDPLGRWRRKLALGDFLLGPKLGEGLTGRVYYAKLRASGCECALKVMRKARLAELGEEAHVRSELEALGRLASPFVTQLLGGFQDARALYLAIEYMRGPDLFAYMHEVHAPQGGERAVPLAAVRFYTAQVLLGLDALHCAGYVYRDLKPENILMDGEGHLRIADLGFAKCLPRGGRAYTVCGTPDYLAPEVIEHRGATRGSDYWALGVLLFEFVAGFPPFTGEPKWYQFRRICTGVIDYTPEGFDPQARALVGALCTVDESRRLGLLAGGMADIRDHPFYAALDWGALAGGALVPPFRPSEHDWGQATVSPAESKRVAAELAEAMADDPHVHAHFAGV